MRGSIGAFATFVTCIGSPVPADACTTVVIPGNQELFRDAVLVYEAVALEEQYEFKVRKVWRGSDRARIRLTWPLEHLESCRGHQPTTPGEAYLLTIQCDDPEPQGSAVFTCPSRAEPLDVATSRLRFLQEAYPLSAEELAGHLRDLRSGRASYEEFAFWVGEMVDLAQVSDWRPVPSEEAGGLWSLTLGTLRELDSLLNGRGVPLVELGCELRHFRKTILPFQIDLLDSAEPSAEDVHRLEAMYRALEDVCW